MATLDMDAKRKQIETWAKYIFIMVGAALAAPIAFMALEGIFLIAACVLVLFLLWNFAPVIATYVANKRIQALVAVVEANPIETMQNLYAEKMDEMTTAETNIRDFETEIRNFDDQCVIFKKQYPEEAGMYIELSTKMHDGLEDMKTQQTAARGELQNFDMQITKAKAIYRMSLAAQKVVKLSKSAEAQVFAKIKEQVAFDTVRTNLNRAFSDLNLALERRHDAKTFASTPAPKQIAEGVTPADMPIQKVSSFTHARKG